MDVIIFILVLAVAVVIFSWLYMVDRKTQLIEMEADDDAADIKEILAMLESNGERMGKIERQLGDFVACSVCGDVIEKRSAKLVEVIDGSNKRMVFFCSDHAPKFDKVEERFETKYNKDGSLNFVPYRKYILNEVEVDKDGKRIIEK
jgi:hypothetical protein